MPMDSANASQTTHFGFAEVPLAEKAPKVRAIFDEVAPKYDLMNDLMSFGLHRLWKFVTCELAQIKDHASILDLAGGTGDLAIRLSKKITSKKGQIIIADINNAMLQVGRDKIINQGLTEKISFCQVDAQCLPFKSNHFDCITIAFGLRNVTQPALALSSMSRCLKPGGKCLILEFSKPISPLLESVYDLYSFKLIPQLGKWIAGTQESYQYLVESIRKHPDQQQLKNLMLANGFDQVNVHNFAGGIVALHIGYKF